VIRSAPLRYRGGVWNDGRFVGRGGEGGRGCIENVCWVRRLVAEMGEQVGPNW